MGEMPRQDPVKIPPRAADEEGQWGNASDIDIEACRSAREGSGAAHRTQNPKVETV